MQSTTGFMHICTEHIFELLYFEICARYLCSQTVNKENDTLGQELSTAQRVFLGDWKGKRSMCKVTKVSRPAKSSTVPVSYMYGI